MVVPVASLFAERYQLTELVGTGGMGAVWSAWDTRLHRQVAIKLVPVEGLAAPERERVVREARATARLRHPNVVTLHDAGEGDGSIYLVMEIVDGITLADRIASSPVPEPEAVRVAAAVLEALAEAHAAGIVHRDVKPSNVLLGANGDVKLADFGIARRLDEVTGGLTATGQHLGTPKYLAPETLAGEPGGVASDVYAVGIVLFEMLTGRPPFDKGSAMATAMAHVNEPAPDVRAAAPSTSPALAAVVARALDKDPARRFVSAREMQAALARSGPSAASSVPLAATEVMPTGRPRAGGGRWWLVAVAAALIAGVVATLVVIGGDDDPETGGATTTSPVSTSAAPTTSPPTTAPTTPPTTNTSPAPPAAAAPGPGPGDEAAETPQTVDQLVAWLDADPGGSGSRTPEIIERLEDLGRGRKASDRAAELLEDLEEWAASGDLAAGALDVIRPVLEPIADGPGNSGRQ